MTRLTLAAAAVAATIFAAEPRLTPVKLDCERSETLALREAPQGASRPSTGRLIVHWRHGTATFRDSGNVAGEIGGVEYEYCGYSPEVEMHLIRKSDDDLFTGVLLDSASGLILPAGKSVTFAPDHSRYFARAQSDGVDGEDWYLYSRTGLRLWRGMSFVSAKNGKDGSDFVAATLEEPHWSATGELRATFTCSVDKKSTTVLTLTARSGVWAWQPKVDCSAKR